MRLNPRRLNPRHLSQLTCKKWFMNDSSDDSNSDVPALDEMSSSSDDDDDENIHAKQKKHTNLMKQDRLVGREKNLNSRVLCRQPTT